MEGRAVRAGLKALVEALADSEIAEINVSERDAQEPVFVLQPGHINAFSMEEPQEVLLLEKVRTMALTLQAPVFRNAQAWFFDNGLQHIQATMGDKDFLSLIDSGIFELQPGDVLVANVRVKTLHRRDVGLVSTYEVSPQKGKALLDASAAVIHPRKDMAMVIGHILCDIFSKVKAFPWPRNSFFRSRSLFCTSYAESENPSGQSPGPSPPQNGADASSPPGSACHNSSPGRVCNFDV